MKWLTTLLTFYLLALSLWPCADEYLPTTGQEGQAMVSAVTTSQSDGTHHHEHHDTCTPFCTCTCCAVTITVVHQFHYSLFAPVEIVSMTVVTFNYTSANPHDLITAIWQPPQLWV